MFEFMYCRNCCVYGVNVLNVLYCVSCKNLESICWIQRVENSRILWNVLRYSSCLWISYLYHRSISAVLNSNQTACWCNFDLREFPQFRPPGHVYMKYSDPGSWSGICVCARALVVLRVTLKLDHTTEIFLLMSLVQY